MQSITFECEVITPMFLAGADGSTPELRPPSIKGALRFWWRALNGHLGDSELRSIEGKIFGDTSHRSNLIIRESKTSISDDFLTYDNQSENYMLPHKTDVRRKSITKSFPENRTSFGIFFGWKRDIQANDYSFTFQNLENLFKIVCCLGGFGKRSRRGFGSVYISQIKINDGEWEDYLMPTTLSEIKTLLGNNFKLNNNIIASQNFSGDYPYVKSIELGDFDKNITKKIINDSHEVKKKEIQRCHDENDYVKDWKTGEFKKRRGKNIPNSKFDNALGNGGRFASPIYVSTINTEEGQRSIITTLNSIPKKGRHRREHEALQTEYKNRLKNNYNG